MKIFLALKANIFLMDLNSHIMKGEVDSILLHYQSFRTGKNLVEHK
jgi:hypothetical protein